MQFAKEGLFCVNESMNESMVNAVTDFLPSKSTKSEMWSYLYLRVYFNVCSNKKCTELLILSVIFNIRLGEMISVCVSTFYCTF